ncbi:MAG: hypothetical protein GY862_19245 [Gammaproteobacteria bacterium]|nr:hypothetical protein [Gammaproteobacteria bacterium]
MSAQIPAYISAETKSQIEAYTRHYGVKKAFLLEEALQHHLQALKDLPGDVIVPVRLVLKEQSFARLVQRLESQEQPSAALRALMHG